MIGKLKGILIDSIDNSIILDVNGVGYKLEGNIVGNIDDSIDVYVHTYVREQEIRLFGFNKKSELILFEYLISVSGVGPKVAIGIMSKLSDIEIYTAILDKDFFKLKAPGVGQKTAEKIIIELKTKVEQLYKSGQITQTNDKPKIDNIYLHEAVQALVSLGYRESDINKLIGNIDQKLIQTKSLSELIKFLLKEINTNPNE
jgi:holliday junction DNA helicase RuvA